MRCGSGEGSGDSMLKSQPDSDTAETWVFKVRELERWHVLTVAPQPSGPRGDEI